jgi:CDP-glucose 4,6-dehydratase
VIPLYKNRSVLVTGHTGFKGSWLGSVLSLSGAQVSGYALKPDGETNLYNQLDLNQKINHSFIGDVRDFENLSKALKTTQPEIIFHLAAQPLVRESYNNPRQTYETNVMGTVNLLDAARSCPSLKAIVVVTSDKCYENREWSYAYRENDPMGGHDPYSNSKGCQELVTAAYRDSFLAKQNILVATARAGNVIGGGDYATDRIVPDMVRAALANQSVLLRSPGSIRPWQHVLEPLDGYLKLGEALLSGDLSKTCGYNFGPEVLSHLKVVDLAKLFYQHWGAGGYTLPQDNNHLHEAQLLSLAIDKAYRELNWSPRWNIAQTIQHTVDWYKNNAQGQDAWALTKNQIESYYLGI